MKFVIPGNPKGKARPIITKSGHAFTPKATVSYENWVKQCYMLSGNKERLEGQIGAHIEAFFAIPKSTSLKRHAEMLSGRIRPTKKPDIDNIVKSILDSLNEMAYKDDSQVVQLVVNKYYSDDPRVEVEIMEIGGDEICPDPSDPE